MMKITNIKLFLFLSHQYKTAQTSWLGKHQHVEYSLQMSHYKISEFQSSIFSKELLPFGAAGVALCYINFKTGLQFVIPSVLSLLGSQLIFSPIQLLNIFLIAFSHFLNSFCLSRKSCGHSIYACCFLMSKTILLCCWLLRSYVVPALLQGTSTVVHMGVWSLMHSLVCPNHLSQTRLKRATVKIYSHQGATA